MILPYTQAQVEDAHEQWNAMCGHYSIAAATGRPLEDIRTAGVPLKGWMNPTMISQTLHALKISHARTVQTGSHALSREELLETAYPCILRIQWEGSWLNPGVPVAASYQRTHYIAAVGGWIMDPAYGPSILMSPEDWPGIVQDQILPQIKNATGWHFTHSWTLQK